MDQTRKQTSTTRRAGHGARIATRLRNARMTTRLASVADGHLAATANWNAMASSYHARHRNTFDVAATAGITTDHPLVGGYRPTTDDRLPGRVINRAHARLACRCTPNMASAIGRRGLCGQRHGNDDGTGNQNSTHPIHHRLLGFVNDLTNPADTGWPDVMSGSDP